MPIEYYVLKAKAINIRLLRYSFGKNKKILYVTYNRYNKF